MTPISQDTPLFAGQVYDLIYDVGNPNSSLLGTALSQIKHDLTRDTRWHYQGFRWQDGTDEAGQAIRQFVATVQIADPAKVVNQSPGTIQPAEAGLGAAVRPVIVYGGVLLALALGAVYAYSAAISFRAAVLAEHPIAAAVQSLSGTAELALLAVLVYLLWGRHP